MAEEIKSAFIEGYDNQYIIYSNGEVFSVKSGRYLNPWLNPNGYKVVSLSKNSRVKKHPVHRLVALYFIPNPNNKICVDHINNDILNNDISNLRWATYQENNWNVKRDITNTSGEKNVCWKKDKNKWQVRFRVNGRTTHFGYFDNFEEACEVARQKRNELRGEFANHS